MLPFNAESPAQIGAELAARVRVLRLARGWSREELALRAGVAPETLKRFERTGQIALARLLSLAVVLDGVDAFDALFRLPPARSIADLRSRRRATGRQRGRTLSR
jgi:transcriptional regulator with XRE-family HTH domain